MIQGKRGGKVEPARMVYEKRLKMLPHYMKEANSLLLQREGILPLWLLPKRRYVAVPGACVFTCLSHDVIAHELTHAMLFGMNIQFEGNNPDIGGFHEAFADLVPLFQHFWESDVLREQIGAIRGNLEERSALGAVALQFGQAIGKPDGLRNALGFTGENGKWQPRQPDTKLYQTRMEPHERGDILVSAIFYAFRKIYESRVADLRRIATRGTGALGEGKLHPDLVNRFAHEAAKSARHVLDMCVRALDYIPPVEITFGDYLRAIITADNELYRIDERHYRVAFVDAFRSYGIFPAEVATLSVTTLLWPPPLKETDSLVVADFVRELSRKNNYWNLPRDREMLWKALEGWKKELHEFLKKTQKRLGPIDLAKPFEVQSLYSRERASLTGELSSQWVIKVVQSAGKSRKGAGLERAGCTLVVDADTGILHYRIEKTTKARAKQHKLEPKWDALPGSGVTPSPVERRLRVFAFDPTLGAQLETAGINEVTLSIPWELEKDGTSALRKGPVGEYLEE